MVPGRRRLPDRPEPADHHAVPHPRGRRPGEPRLRLRRSPADDDRRHEAAGALLLAADDAAPMAEAGGRLFVDVTRVLASPASRAGLLDADGEVRSADPGRAARPSSTAATSSGRSRTRAPAWAAGRGAAARRRRRSGDRRRADRAHRGLPRRPEARHPHEVRPGAARLHPGGPPGAAADPVRSARATR